MSINNANMLIETLVESDDAPEHEKDLSPDEFNLAEFVIEYSDWLSRHTEGLSDEEKQSKIKQVFELLQQKPDPIVFDTMANIVPPNIRVNVDLTHPKFNDNDPIGIDPSALTFAYLHGCSQTHAWQYCNSCAKAIAEGASLVLVYTPELGSKSSYTVAYSALPEFLAGRPVTEGLGEFVPKYSLNG